MGEMWGIRDWLTGDWRLVNWAGSFWWTEKGAELFEEGPGGGADAASVLALAA